MSEPASVPCGSKSARGTSNGVDRLSSLPEALLHHVMSFLPMPEVVRTSVLSPRWRNLWASTPFIRIDEEDFLDVCDEGTDNRKLEKFGDHLLLLRDGTVPLDEAQIFINSSGDNSNCLAWIRHVIKHNARLLHVHGPLRDYNIPRLDSTVMCPSQHLKRIMLQDVRLVDGLFRPLNYDFPVLEDLELVDCTVSTSAEISSRSLKSLRIRLCCIDKDLLICARNLTHLSICPFSCSGAIVTRDLSSLITASISVYVSFHGPTAKIVNHRLLDGLSHGRTLELQAPLHELAFESGLETCPMFSNLTSLVLGDWSMAADFDLLLCILQHSLMLKELIFKLRMEECRVCKNAAESALPSSSRRRTLPGSSDSYPRIERVKINCPKNHPRVGALVQVLLPIVIPAHGKISVEGSCTWENQCRGLLM